MWDERYATAEYVYGTAPNVFLTGAAAHIRPGGRVLAVADGEGRNGVWLAGQGFEVVSVDASAVALAKAGRLAAERGVKLALEHADLLRWDWPVGAFDAVVAIFIQFAGPQDRARLFESMKQAVRPGGVLILQGYRPEQIAYGTGGPPNAENLYTEAMLGEMFAGWHTLHLKAHDCVITEGTGHHGLSALIDLIARKPKKPGA
ncbi:MAG: SAM-dependent methyltransferase [Oceanicaulis sp.]